VTVDAAYEREFVLVQWDQRGAGKTYGRYGDATPDLSLRRVAEDGIELARYLHARLPGKGEGSRSGRRCPARRTRGDRAAGPPNVGQYFAFTRSIRSHFGAADREWLGGLLERTRALVSDAELEALGDGMTFSGRTVIATLVEENLSTTALRFDLPYYVVQGRDDVSAPTANG
jgi:hypothetical protein